MHKALFDSFYGLQYASDGRDGSYPNIEGKDEKGELPYVPIIACTAFALKSQLDACLQVGMDDCLTIPMSKDTLRTLIQKWG